MCNPSLHFASSAIGLTAWNTKHYAVCMSPLLIYNYIKLTWPNTSITAIRPSHLNVRMAHVFVRSIESSVNSFAPRPGRIKCAICALVHSLHSANIKLFSSDGFCCPLSDYIFLHFYNQNRWPDWLTIFRRGQVGALHVRQHSAHVLPLAGRIACGSEGDHVLGSRDSAHRGAGLQFSALNFTCLERNAMKLNAMKLRMRK